MLVERDRMSHIHSAVRADGGINAPRVVLRAVAAIAEGFELDAVLSRCYHDDGGTKWEVLLTLGGEALALVTAHAPERDHWDFDDHRDQHGEVMATVEARLLPLTDVVDLRITAMEGGLNGQEWEALPTWRVTWRDTTAFEIPSAPYPTRTEWETAERIAQTIRESMLKR